MDFGTLSDAFDQPPQLFEECSVACVICTYQMTHMLEVEYFREFPMCSRCFNVDTNIMKVIYHRRFEMAVRECEQRGSLANAEHIVKEFRGYLINK
jgi:hypothetical protein